MISESDRVANPTRYELIDKDGLCVGTFDSLRWAIAMAKTAYPDQSQDEDRRGLGWDIQIAGAK